MTLAEIEKLIERLRELARRCMLGDYKDALNEAAAALAEQRAGKDREDICPGTGYNTLLSGVPLGNGECNVCGQVVRVDARGCAYVHERAGRREGKG